MAIELADIIRRFGPLYLERFSGGMPISHKKVISDIQQCRTEAKGGHIYQCERCGKKVYVYHACRKWAMLRDERDWKDDIQKNVA